MQMTEPDQAPRWAPLERNERRVLGVLVEKAKTTPSAYPLTLNSIRTGSNQKSNRFPMMELEEHHVEEALEGLRKAGAVTMLQGDGRTEKFRHLAYEWMGVDKVELAVMAELLLRGAQTLGDLRTRAARMEPIKGQEELKPIVDALVARGLMIYLTPPGRGAMVTHNLYQPQELQKVQAEHGSAGAPAAAPPAPIQDRPIQQPGFREDPPAPRVAPPQAPTPAAHASPGPASDSGDDLREEVRSLRAELSEVRTQLQDEINELRSELEELMQQVTG
jgi:uncharacterized protein YceH (UPF0502 family)